MLSIHLRLCNSLLVPDALSFSQSQFSLQGRSQLKEAKGHQFTARGPERENRGAEGTEGRDVGMPGAPLLYRV